MIKIQWKKFVINGRNQLNLNNQESIEEFANNISVTWASTCATRIMNGLLEQMGYIRQIPNPNIFKDNKNG